jgi:hypothetical protein
MWEELAADSTVIEGVRLYYRDQVAGREYRWAREAAERRKRPLTASFVFELKPCGRLKC